MSNTLWFLEPIGGSAPKFSSVAIEQILVSGSQPISLTCPAQGSPCPAFRYFILYTGSQITFMQNQLVAPRQNFPLERLKMCFRPKVLNLLYYAQPKGLQHQHFGKKLQNTFPLEPIGGTKPKFSNADTKNIFGFQSFNIGLQCSAQGSPRPAFRYVTVLPFFQSQLVDQFHVFCLMTFRLSNRVSVWLLH